MGRGPLGCGSGPETLRLAALGAARPQSLTRSGVCAQPAGERGCRPLDACPRWPRLCSPGRALGTPPPAALGVSCSAGFRVTHSRRPAPGASVSLPFCGFTRSWWEPGSVCHPPSNWELAIRPVCLYPGRVEAKSVPGSQSCQSGKPGCDSVWYPRTARAWESEGGCSPPTVP